MALLTRGYRAHVRAAVVAISALGVGGCVREEIVQPVREAVAVHAMGVVGSVTFGVALSQVSIFSGAPIGGASIRLLRESSSVDLVEAGEASAYCFSPPDEDVFGGGGYLPDARCYAANLSQPIAAGESLRLEIELVDGTVIHGRTVTPALPQQVTPSGDEPIPVTFYLERYEYGGFVVASEPLEIRWQSLDDQAAELNLVPRMIFYGDSAIVPEPCDFYSDSEYGRYTRSPALLDAPAFCQGSSENPVWDSVHVDLRIAAYDDAYLRYAAAFHAEGTGVVLDHAAVGIELVAGDAVVTGVFGSTAPVTVPLRLHSVVVDRR